MRCGEMLREMSCGPVGEEFTKGGISSRGVLDNDRQELKKKVIHLLRAVCEDVSGREKFLSIII